MLLAADADVLLSIVLGHAASRAIEEGGVEIATTFDTLEEVREYLPVVADQYGIRAGILEARLEALAVKAYGPRKYRSKLGQATRRIGKRDMEDAGLLALALAMRIAVWTNDRDFEKTGVETITTAKLLTKLGIRGKPS